MSEIMKIILILKKNSKYKGIYKNKYLVNKSKNR